MMNVWKNVLPIPLVLTNWIRETLVDDIEEDPEDLGLIGSLAGKWGPVNEHVDDGIKPVWGLILHSDKHTLYQSTQERLLEPGDVYCLDPQWPHGTRAPFADSLLVFAVCDRPTYHQEPLKVATDLLLEAGRAMEQLKQSKLPTEDQIARYMYRGIQGREEDGR